VPDQAQPDHREEEGGVTRIICDWQSDEAIQRFAQAIWIASLCSR
jgi:hypothetical protein